MLYLIESKHTETTTDIYEFHRNEDGTAETKVITNFKPYFFVDHQAPIEKLEGVLKVEGGFTSIENTPVKKVVVVKSSMVKPMRQKVEDMGYNHWEADILFNNRYTIDLKQDIGEGKLKVCWLDIETNSDKTFPNMETADQEICCLSVKIGDIMTTWLCGDKSFEGVRYFPKEEDMLEDFMSFIYKESPDIISAWNLEGFDMLYIIRRCKRLEIDYKRLSKIREVWDRSYKNRIYFKLFGTVQIDLLEAYKLWRKYGNLPLLQSYSLDFVARSILDDKKLDHGKTMHWLWKNDLKTLIDYNRHDVELLDKLDKRCRIIDFFDEIRRKCHIQFEDVYKTTAIIDGYLIHRLKKKVILPTAKHNKDEKFEGAYVFNAIPGIYNNILCEDIASMYPSIIKNFNISYETVGGGQIILPLDPPISFSKKPGIIPMFLDELSNERNVFKNKRDTFKKGSPEWGLYDQRQFGTKILMNSFFGYLGYIGSRLYKKPVASAITGMGKYLILKIAYWVENLGNKVIYGDTDSVYITSKEKDPYKTVFEGSQIMKHINKKLDEECKKIAGFNLIKIEFEKALERVLFTDAKKRYAYRLLWEENNKFNVDKTIQIQGFDSKRSDSNNLSKVVQKNVIQMVMDAHSKKDVVAYLYKMNDKMKNGEVSHNDIGFPRGISKDLESYNPPSALIKGAYYSNKNFGTNFGRGSKPKYAYIKKYKGMEKTIYLNNKTYILESIAFENTIPDGFEINWDRMSDNTFKNKLIKIFDSAGWEWQDLNYVGLDSFM